MSAPASQPQLEKKHLDKDQGPDSLRSILRMIDASVGDLSNSKLVEMSEKAPWSP